MTQTLREFLNRQAHGRARTQADMLRKHAKETESHRHVYRHAARRSFKQTRVQGKDGITY